MDLWEVCLPFDDEALSWKVLYFFKIFLGSETVGVAYGSGFAMVTFLGGGAEDDDLLPESNLLKLSFFKARILTVKSPGEIFHNQMFISESVSTIKNQFSRLSYTQVKILHSSAPREQC